MMRLLTSVSLSKSTNCSTVCPMDTLDLDTFALSLMLLLKSIRLGNADAVVREIIYLILETDFPGF